MSPYVPETDPFEAVEGIYKCVSICAINRPERLYKAYIKEKLG